MRHQRALGSVDLGGGVLSKLYLARELDMGGQFKDHRYRTLITCLFNGTSVQLKLY